MTKKTYCEPAFKVLSVENALRRWPELKNDEAFIRMMENNLENGTVVASTKNYSVMEADTNIANR